MKWCLQEDGRPWLISLAHELLCKLLALSHTSAMMPTLWYIPKAMGYLILDSCLQNCQPNPFLRHVVIAM